MAELYAGVDDEPAERNAVDKEADGDAPAPAKAPGSIEPKPAKPESSGDDSVPAHPAASGDNPQPATSDNSG